MSELIHMRAFGGKIPVAGDRALPDGFATESLNTWLYSQELRGERPPKDIIAVASTTRKVLRIPSDTAVPSDLYAVDNVWKLFTDPDTDYVLSPTVKDGFKRVYWASPSTGPRMNTRANLQAGLIPAGYFLGVPSPATAMGGAVAGGAVPVATRSYLYTFVNIYGEESAPSPPLVLAGNADGTWNMTGIVDPTTGQFDNYATYQKKYVYRTITSASGVATFFRVAEIAPGTTTFADTVADTVLANQLQLESTTWAVAPTGMQGVILMPSGFMIGWVGKDVYFSEVFHPHAWPAEYIITVEFPIVGLGVVGNTCVVCTQGYPSAIQGVHPASTSLTKSTSNEPCLSRGSIVSTPNGVVYASQNGLVLAAPGGFTNITEKLMTREQWLTSFAPKLLRAARYQNGFLALRLLSSAANRTGFFLDPSALQVALTELSELSNTVNVFPDIWSGEVLIIQNNTVRQWDPQVDDYLPVLWRSKEFQLKKNENFGAYSIYWDQTRFRSNSFGTAIIASDVAVRFRAWCNRALVYDRTVPKNGLPCRLPSGFKGDIWQFEIRARAPVYSCHIATTERMLAQV